MQPPLHASSEVTARPALYLLGPRGDMCSLQVAYLFNWASHLRALTWELGAMETSLILFAQTQTILRATLRAVAGLEVTGNMNWHQE